MGGVGRWVGRTRRSLVCWGSPVLPFGPFGCGMVPASAFGSRLLPFRSDPFDLLIPFTGPKHPPLLSLV